MVTFTCVTDARPREHTRLPVPQEGRQPTERAAAQDLGASLQHGDLLPGTLPQVH